MTTENDTQVTEPAVPQESAPSVPRLVIILEGEPEDAVRLLHSVVTAPIKGGRRGPKLSAEVAKTIRERLAAGESKEALARELQVTVATVEQIRDGRTYRETASP